jgi:hypothetical protein
MHSVLWQLEGPCGQTSPGLQMASTRAALSNNKIRPVNIGGEKNRFRENLENFNVQKINFSKYS